MTRKASKTKATSAQALLSIRGAIEAALDALDTWQRVVAAIKALRKSLAAGKADYVITQDLAAKRLRRAHAFAVAMTALGEIAEQDITELPQDE